ncbi:glycoside hydrolase family 9 protein [Chryseosolibacter indicus]|uniref:Glycoside hydrolase family 9 protein n=1 Tax=Chryseosolibacter indicus TaxID=2782351 RepID=A0ABS5VTG7_9BACT|nr:glycoside hydrolase family 9 protein [Chryseosolibacter indicus]MBT1704122.1 glycoside hydrolase family 9 protein [Chryseosolibacter indicus]
MIKSIPLTLIFFCQVNLKAHDVTPDPHAWIRINQLGYRPGNPKNAVWCSAKDEAIKEFQIVDVASNKVVYNGNAGKPFGAYGPFPQTYRLDFTNFKTLGRFKIRVNGTESPPFTIGENVYDGAADFCLRYMRQQRTGFNPYLKDSCHTHDGYVLYGEQAGIKDSTYADVVGGWHDASDYLQYATTSANATYHLLAAYRDFPIAFKDEKQANGLAGRNGHPDVLDEAKWGLDWLLKMHPDKDVMFNQIGDDRDHYSMRIPKMDSVYGKGYQRPVYFINGEVQQRGKFLNNTKGTSSTAAKLSSAFSLGAQIFEKYNSNYSKKLKDRSLTAYQYALKKPGVTQTVSVKSPYIYAEDNWVDDMELAAASVNYLKEAKEYADKEPQTPWLGADTASHYQWYPFINIGHYELAKQLQGKEREHIISYYRKGIQLVFEKASKNAFMRGVPFIWCSNNLTTSFAIQCFWYKQLTGDKQFEALEQANVDWLFGCNPWGTSMVYGLPSWGDTPVDPHSAFTRLKNYPIDGGLVDGPVYTRIYKSLIGIHLNDPDEYASFQSDLAVYHDDYGDYSTNEPTMDGTASLIYLLAAKQGEKLHGHTTSLGALIKGNDKAKNIALVFTGDTYFDGLSFITKALKQNGVKAGFFFTGRLYENKEAQPLIKNLMSDGHYFGPHSDKHLLYNDWMNRDSLLVSKDSMINDLKTNYQKMEALEIKNAKKLFIPPYEWWNSAVASWCSEEGIQLISFTPGLTTNADYTYPEMGTAYKSSNTILKTLYEKEADDGLNGSIMLIHIGTDPRRKDKLYNHLPQLIKHLKSKGYQFKRIDQLFYDSSH